MNNAALHQFVQGLPDPSRIKEVYIDITWNRPIGGGGAHTAIWIMGFWAVVAVAVAVIIATIAVTRKW